MNRLFYILFAMTIVSCEKEEEPVKKHLPGDSILNSFEMGSDYRKQAFYDLKTNTFVSENLKGSWDLGFENGVNGNHIILNSSNFMAAAKVDNISFNNVQDTVGLIWQWDASSGNFDSTAFGNIEIGNVVYVVDRGLNEQGVSRGFCKLIINSITANSYSFKIANLDGSLEEEVTVVKDNNLNLNAYSITNRVVVDIEPAKTEWDFMFSQYVHYFHAQDEAYLVTGILTNRYEVQVAEVFDIEYEAITSEDISSQNFSSNIDIIGYDWKEFGFSTGAYIIYSDKNYIIKSTEGLYFKLHFIDFYNEQGDKGTPVFELQEL